MIAGDTGAKAACAYEAGVEAASERVRDVWLANARQELLAPATAILEISVTLLKDARDSGVHDLARDLQKIQAAGNHLLSMVHDILDPATHEQGNEEVQRRLRHDLRTPLNHVMGYCELWLEDSGEWLPEVFRSDLQRLTFLARQLLEHIDELLKVGRIAGHSEVALEIAAVPAMVREALAVKLPDSADSKDARKGSILVVDDNAVNRELLQRRLERAGHEVALAQDGRQALALITSRKFDLILLDIIMPELNGFQILEHLKADSQLRHIPVIMISALTEIVSIARCVEMGADDFLCKPFNSVLLDARINGCLEKKHFRDREASYLEQIQRERARADELLHVILPGPVVQELKSNKRVQPRRHENVAVMFCDIVGFTPYCDHNRPEDVVAYLQELTEGWEQIVLGHGVEKIKTIGDAMMAAAGLLQACADPVLACLRCGLEMIGQARCSEPGWKLRVGIHAGPVVAGVIGSRQFLYDLWGDTVNTAARMESNGVPGKVVLSGTAWRQVADKCRGESLGMLPIKGKGHMELMRFDSFVA
ncbi:MAG TPA: adenylate/guanylate cyclase domain-containing protein [Gemmataceae bacterium]|jgi:class 3 adenylate cyclase|nr:adenylate/guanylate cyclase domain-containing protein [Gemmataceae bacterium]